MPPYKEVNKGFGIIEIIIALGIFTIIASVGAINILHSFSSDRLSDEYNNALLYAQEGIEAVKSIDNQSFTYLIPGVYGVDKSTGNWQLSGNQNSDPPYARTITISQVQRDVNGNIISSGGTIDGDTYKIESMVRWNFTPTRNNNVNLVSYLTNWRKTIECLWSSTAQLNGSADLTGTTAGTKVAISENYVYIVRDTNSGTTPDFIIVDMSNRNNPQVINEIDLNSNIYDIYISGNYVYLATGRTDRELWIIDVNNPASPNLDYAYANLPASARSIDVNGDYLYVVTDNVTGNELHVFGISSLPVLNGPWGVDLGRAGRAINASDNYVLVATADGNRQLMVIDTTNKTAPVMNINWSYKTPSCSAAGTGVFAAGSTAYLVTLNCNGNRPELNILNVSNYKTNINLIGSYNMADNINDIYVNGSRQVFLATESSNSEFIILNAANPANLDVVKRINLDSDANGIAIDNCIAVTVNSKTDSELQVFSQP